MHLKANQAPGEIFLERWPRVNAVVKRILNMEDVPLTDWHGMFEDVYQITVWESESHDHIRASLTETIKEYILNVQRDLMANQDESSLLKAYIVQWNKFANHSETLSLPFGPLRSTGGQQPSDPNRRSARDSCVKKIMLETWNTCIYEVLQQKLLDSAIKLIQSDRCGQLIDSSLVIGISESCVILSGAQSTKKPKYVSQLEHAYIEGTKSFYRSRIAQFVQEHGIRVRFFLYILAPQ
ncbi:Cullin-5 [Fasciolopsis buskii]|uniref:Cullin-5 n=1 Tax=Fasciolopsis buskii TaxID=27845 RepID=A0A8E0S1W5_9TREM|nr:Cullin-5 [Fasciolopsis buski]